MASVLDEFLKDVSAVSKELTSARDDIKSGVKEVLGDVAGLKDDVRDTIDGTKSDISRAKQELQGSLKIFPDRTQSGSGSVKGLKASSSKGMDIIKNDHQIKSSKTKHSH